MKIKSMVVCILPLVFLNNLVSGASCSFDNSKSCTLATDLLHDKASNGLNFYAATNYDHRVSGEINVYDTSKVIKNADGSLGFLATQINSGFWKSAEIMTRANLNSPPFNSPVASQVWTTSASKHGYLEVNVTLPKCTVSTDGSCQKGTNPTNYNQGLWPAIWLMPTYDSNWPQNGEIDIMEAYPQNTAFDIVTATLHFNGNSNQCGGNDCKGWGYPLNSFRFPQVAYANSHTWGFEWELDSTSVNKGYLITGYIDNVKIWGPTKTDSLPADGGNALQRGFNDPNGGYYLIVNLAVGGPYAGSPNSQMQEARMQVNSAKFYEVGSASTPGTCNVPSNINSTYTIDKKNITLKWSAPTTGSTVTSYQIKDWQKKVLWQGSNLQWTDISLPGKNGTYTYYIDSICNGIVSPDTEIDVLISDNLKCQPPANIQVSASQNKKNATLKWTVPVNSLPVSSYQVRDWQQKVLWQGTDLSWTDTSLSGTAGTFIYYINTNCNNISSTAIETDLVIK